MTTVILIIHLMLAVTMIVIILMQRSEGGALGIGGGGGGLMSGRGAANLLTRTTSILGALFFVTSLVLGILAREASEYRSVIDPAAPASAPATGGSQLPQVQIPRPAAPQETAPATPQAPAAPQVPRTQ